VVLAGWVSGKDFGKRVSGFPYWQTGVGARITICTISTQDRQSLIAGFAYLFSELSR